MHICFVNRIDTTIFQKKTILIK